MNEDAKDLAEALRGAYLTMHRRADNYCTKHGVTADQFVLLLILSQEGAVTQQRLVQRASSDPTTVGAMLMLLEGRGLVKRRRHPLDGRARSVTLTKKGHKAHQRLLSACEPFYAELVSEYQPDEVQALVGLLRRIPPVLAARSRRPQ